jgi:hypothetical protein
LQVVAAHSLTHFAQKKKEDTSKKIKKSKKIILKKKTPKTHTNALQKLLTK